MRIVILGRPASGKSTLTAQLAARFPELGTFSVRRHFTRQVQLDTPVGNQVRDIVSANGWIPDDLVAAAVRDQFRSGALGPDFIMEGMPGNRRQAELLDELLDDLRMPLDAAVWVQTPEELCLNRAARRLVCYQCDGGSHQATAILGTMTCARCGGPVTKRSADAEEPFQQRLTSYRQQTEELASYYRDERTIEVDGRWAPERLRDEVIGRLRVGGR
jgi:adenylate kinase